MERKEVEVERNVRREEREVVGREGGERLKEIVEVRVRRRRRVRSIFVVWRVGVWVVLKGGGIVSFG